MDNNVVILSDEIHFDLIMPGYKHTVMANLSEALRQHTVTFTSPSKTFNIAGLQLSNIVIPNADLRKKFKASMGRDMVSWMNALCYKACQLAYDLCEPWLEELLKHLDHNRQLVEDFIRTGCLRRKYTGLKARTCSGLICAALGWMRPHWKTGCLTTIYLWMKATYLVKRVQVLKG